MTRAAVVSGVVGVLATIAVALGGTSDPYRALVAWLVAFTAVASLAIGALILYLTGFAANARWLAVMRRLNEAIVSVFPLLVILFLPIAFGVHHLYPWADPDVHWTAAQARVIDAKRSWLDPTAFGARGVVYLAVCALVAEVLRARSHRRDVASVSSGPLPGGEDVLSTVRAIASASLPVVGLAITFAAFDWIMSLDPTWSSTMFGVYLFAGGFVAGIAALVILAERRRRAAPELITPHHFHALGRLLFAFTVFWAYTAYFQAFLIQIADRPNEVTFYLARLDHGWKLWIAVLAIGHFALPFALLLPRSVKMRPRYVAAVGAWMLAMHYGDVYWLVAPAAGPFSPHWLDLAALVAVVGLGGAWCLVRQRGLSLDPIGDPFLVEGIAYRSPT
jgi:hypothetical protein